MPDRDVLEAVFRRYDFEDFKWFDPKNTVVASWIRMKCLFGCPDYGKNGTCPPNVPSVEDCARFFQEYRRGVIFHFKRNVDKPEDRFPWTKKISLRLIALEREIFLSGMVKAFLMPLDSCQLCKTCPGTRAGCKFPLKARPTPEALAVDVYTTVLRAGYPIEVLSDYDKAMNRYAFLLID